MQWCAITVCLQTPLLSSLLHFVGLLMLKSFVNPAGRYADMINIVYVLYLKESHFITDFCHYLLCGLLLPLQLMRKVLGTHLGHSAIYTMCRIMEERYFIQRFHTWATFMYRSLGVNTFILHQGVHGRCTFVEGRSIFCWHGTVGSTSTPCT